MNEIENQPWPVVGQPCHVLAAAGSDLEHDFTGPVTRVDKDNYLVFVEDPKTGDCWGVPLCDVTPL